MPAPKILAFAGSTRTGSHNKRLVRVAADAARAAGAEVTVIDLRDYPMPHYDGDLEASEGLPATAVALKELFKNHDGLLISAPEYNGGISGMLKNTIDWLSRKSGDEPARAAFAGKIAGIMSASPGALGGLRGLGQLRHVLTSLGVLVIPQQRALGGAHKAHGEDGKLLDPAQQGAIEGIAHRVVDLVRRHTD